MLPEAAVTYFGQLSSRALAAAAVELNQRVREFQQDCNRRGVGAGGGSYDLRLAAIHTEGLAKCKCIVMQCIEKVHTDFGSGAEEDVKGQLIEIGTRALDAQHHGLEDAFRRHFESRGTVAKYSSGLSQRHQMLAVALANSIGEYFWQLRNVPMKSQQFGAGTQIVNNGSIGIVQTGAGSTATLQQQVSGGDASNLIDALEKLLSALAADKGVAAEVRAALQDSIQNATAELKQASPDKTRLADWLVLLASTVQAIASAQPAYEAVRSAAQTLGISL
jgi:hypothetical protein